MSTLPLALPSVHAHPLRVYAKEIRYEFLQLLRRKSFSLATIGFPVMFYLLFGIANRRDSIGHFQIAKYLLGGYACFGLVGAALFGIGVGLAMERTAGWLDLKRASPMPPLAYLVAKCVTAMAFGLIIVTILIVLGTCFGGVHLSLAELATMLAFTVAGSVPFAAMGLLLALVMPANATPGIINLIYLPMSFMSGLWVPIEALPHWLQKIAPVLPTYHLAQAMLGIFGYAQPGSIVSHWVALLGFTLLFLGVSWMVFQRADEERVNSAGKETVMTEGGAYTTEKPMEKCEKTDWSDYVWLAYSVFFLIEPIVRNSLRYWLENAAVFIAFLAVYILTVRAREQRQQLIMIGAMAVLGAIGFTFNLGASCFFTFAAAFLPFSIASVPIVVACLLGGGVFIIAEALLIHADWINTGIALVLVAIVGTSNIFIAQKKNANARLSLAQDEIERLAAVAERERIARDMHDVLGHTLSVIVLKAELARRLLEQQTPETALAASEIAEVESTARTALAEVRKAIVGYRAEGLSAELEQARRTLRSAGVELTFDAAPLALTATEETVLSLAIREAVTNIVRHAQARNCMVTLARTAEGLHALRVEDDGKGPVLREGNGLRGMRERVETLGGRLRVAAGSGNLGGTTLVIELPTARASSAATLPAPAPGQPSMASA